MERKRKMRNPFKASRVASPASSASVGKFPYCCSKEGLKTGPWTPEEDDILTDYITRAGEGQWRRLAKRAGLLRCGKSCRLRWMNYLRPSLKHGQITPEEEDLILRLHRLVGNRWALISRRIPGRTDNDIKNYWNIHLTKKLISQGIDPRTHKPLNLNANSSTFQPLSPKLNPNKNSSKSEIMGPNPNNNIKHKPCLEEMGYSGTNSSSCLEKMGCGGSDSLSCFWPQVPYKSNLYNYQNPNPNSSCLEEYVCGSENFVEERNGYLKGTNELDHDYNNWLNSNGLMGLQRINIEDHMAHCTDDVFSTGTLSNSWVYDEALGYNPICKNPISYSTDGFENEYCKWVIDHVNYCL